MLMLLLLLVLSRGCRGLVSAPSFLLFASQPASQPGDGTGHEILERKKVAETTGRTRAQVF